MNTQLISSYLPALMQLAKYKLSQLNLKNKLMEQNILMQLEINQVKIL